jgi:hypothetical protein
VQTAVTVLNLLYLAWLLPTRAVAVAVVCLLRVVVVARVAVVLVAVVRHLERQVRRILVAVAGAVERVVQLPVMVEQAALVLSS